MHTVEHCLRAPRKGAPPKGRHALALMILMALAICTGAHAQQLQGRYTIGTGGNYPSIEAAITAVVTNGVSGPVTFLINSGTYTPPAGGYTLSQVTTMSAINTVTFRPNAGASVTIDGTNTNTIFDISGGDYYILDGSNTIGGTSRDWKVVNQSTTGRVIRFINGATNNVVRNMTLVGSATSNTVGIVSLSTSSTGGNSNNRIANNLLGDVTGARRSAVAVYAAGSAGADINSDNSIEGNEIVNFGTPGVDAYGVHVVSGNRLTKILRNSIHNDVNTGLTGNVEGIRYNNTTDNQLDTIAYNRIWNLATTNRFSTLRGIYARFSSSSTMTIHNNMVSVIAADGTLAGIYVEPSSTTAIPYLYYNSVYVGGSNQIAATTSYGIWIGSAGTLRNNIVVNNRTSLGSGTNRVLHRESTSGTFSSDNNLLYAGAASTAIGFQGSVRATLADWRSATSQETNTVVGAPGFVNPAAGDLHIAPGALTLAEGRGTPVAGLTTDFDGAERNATTPDIGADEGAFATAAADLMASHATVPVMESVISSSSVFTPTGIFYNTGSSTLSNVLVRFRIKEIASNNIVYNNTQTIASIAAGDMRQVAFPALTAPLAPGTYSIELVSELANDNNTVNDIAVGTVVVRGPMSGTYSINPSGTGARNFVSIPAALYELKLLGVNGPVTFEIAAGTYNALTMALPLSFTQVTGMSAANTVTFRPAASANVLLDAGNSTALIDIDGGDYYIFDGSNSGSASRNWQVINRQGRAIRFINGATNNVVRNMSLMSENSSTTTGIVAFATAGTEGNSNNLIVRNTIGDSAGTSRSSVGIYAQGTTSAKNVANRIEENDIINFGNGSGDAYGIFIGTANQQVKVIGNRIRMTAKGTASGDADGIRFANATDNLLDTIAHNRIWDISSTSTTATRNFRGINVAALGTGSTLTLFNNMIALANPTGALSAINIDPSVQAVVYVYHNSVSISGTTTAASNSQAVWKSNDAVAVLRNNILSNTRVSTGTAINTIFRVAGTNGAIVSNNNLLFSNGATTSVAVTGTTTTVTSATLPEWRTASGQDAQSVMSAVAIPFIDIASANLRIDQQSIFQGESIGTPAGITVDVDMAQRDPASPDAGADEGDFNGGGLVVVTPNGDEKVPVDYTLDVNFTANRAMNVRVELSVDGGTTWTTSSTLAAVPGMNTLTINTPSIVTNNALLRVISTRNGFEADTTNKVFALVNPIVTVLAPNGGEDLVPTDTVRVRWNSQFVAPGMRVAVEYSVNGGASWSLIKSDIVASNLPGTNSVDWVVPNLMTEEGLVRVRVIGRKDADVSNSFFSILAIPEVKLLSPNGGERLVAGQVDTIRWTSVTTTNVRLEYSTNGGTTWNSVVPNGVEIPAYMGAYPWTVPGVSTDRALVRVVSFERTRFSDASDATFTILHPTVQILTPNGGESFELNQPVTVTWNSQAVATFRLDYSDDNGATWKTVMSNVDGTKGSVTFTPPGFPTNYGLVRLVDVTRNQVQDRSDLPFQILPAKSITVNAPMFGDRFVRNSTTVISWNAPRVGNVRVEYSSNNGSTWQVLVPSMPASLGSYVWTVPDQKTNEGKIRIVEIDGSLVGESGVFAIVDQAPPTLRVVAPNGGESFTVGDVAKVRWTASGVGTVSIYYSTNGGMNWTLIEDNVSASFGSFDWTITSAPGTDYRVKVEGNGGLEDASDASFTVRSRVIPALTVLYPNGGQNFTVDTTVEVRWSAENLSGDVTLEYSIDGGANWKPVATVAALSERYTWVIPNDTTRRALLRITTADGLLSDVSDAVWQISAKVVLPVRVVAPNGGERLTMGSTQTITWDAPDAVASVDIYYSTDGGTSWTLAQTNVPSVAGSRQYTWTVPTLPATVTNALVRIWNSADTNQRDISDALFTIEQGSTLAVDDAVTGARSLRLMGNFPNPFVGTTEIRWQQARNGMVELTVYAQDGRQVGSYSIGNREVGTHRHVLNASDLTSGMYIYELRIGSDAVRGTMVVVR